MNEFANKHVGTNLHVEQLSRMLDEIGLNEEGEDHSDVVSVAVRSPNPGKKTKSP